MVIIKINKLNLSLQLLLWVPLVCGKAPDTIGIHKHKAYKRSLFSRSLIWEKETWNNKYQQKATFNCEPVRVVRIECKEQPLLEWDDLEKDFWRSRTWKGIFQPNPQCPLLTYFSVLELCWHTYTHVLRISLPDDSRVPQATHAQDSINCSSKPFVLYSISWFS